MLGMNKTPMKLRRVEGDGTVTEGDIMGTDLTDGQVSFPVDADVEIGDEVSYMLPNGKLRTLEITQVDVLAAPPGMSKTLEHTLCKYTVVNPKTALRQPPPVTLPGLHPLISDASGSNIASHHHDDSVFNAFKAVEDRVKKLTGNADIGKRLMTGVFNEQAPALDITSDNADASQKDDEREGYKFLFMGAAQGLRNPRGHGGKLQTDEQEAMEMLALASFLMRALDRAEKRKP